MTGGTRQASKSSLPRVRLGWAGPVLMAALLAGCATPPPPSADSLSGRLAVRIDSQPPRNVNADFELSGTPAQGQLTLSGPLGATAAQAHWTPGEAVLVSGGQRSRFDTLDALATEALGERIPIAALFDWLRARPWPGATATPRGDGQPGFEQLGWQISLARRQEGWIEARRSAPPAVTVRARLESPP